MNVYTMYFYRPDCEIPDFDFIPAATLDGAVEEARHQLELRSGAQCAEIFDGERIVGRVSAPVRDEPKAA